MIRAFSDCLLVRSTLFSTSSTCFIVVSIIVALMLKSQVTKITKFASKCFDLKLSQVPVGGQGMPSGLSIDLKKIAFNPWAAFAVFWTSGSSSFVASQAQWLSDVQPARTMCILSSVSSRRGERGCIGCGHHSRRDHLPQSHPKIDP